MRTMVVEAIQLRAGDRVLAGEILRVNRVANVTDLVTVTVKPTEGDIVKHHYEQTQRLRIRRDSEEGERDGDA